MSSSPPARLHALDVLRGVAVLLVIARHLPTPPRGAGVEYLPLQLLARGGWCGVDLFFVLSGFLVAGLVLREHARTGRFQPLTFLARRGFKIYPGFYVFLLLGILVEQRLGLITGVSSGRVAAEALFVQSYAPAVFGHTWSLAIEEHFYVALVLLAAWLARRPGADAFAPVLPITAVIAVGCLASRLHLASWATFSFPSHLYPTHLRIDALACGVALAWLQHAHGEALARFSTRFRLLTPVGLALVSPAFLLELEHPFMHTVGLTSVYLGFAALLVAAFHAEGRRTRPGRVLAWIGARSYAIYLWHMTALGVVLHAARSGALPPVPWLVLSLQVLAAVLVGALAAWVVERPFLRLREKVVPSRAGALEAPSPARSAA